MTTNKIIPVYTQDYVFDYSKDNTVVDTTTPFPNTIPYANGYFGFIDGLIDVGFCLAYKDENGKVDGLWSCDAIDEYPKWIEDFNVLVEKYGKQDENEAWYVSDEDQAILDKEWQALVAKYA